MIAESCRDFRRALLLGQLEGAHGASCEACRAFRERERHAAALIRDVYAEQRAPQALRDRVAAAVEAARADSAPGSRRADRRALGAAAMLAVAAGVVIAILVRGGAEPSAERSATVAPHEHPGERGSVDASAPRHLELGGAAADLDPGALVTWRRDGSTLVVEQAGSARWIVGDDTQLRIETAAISAAVTATGASLRVEVPVNTLDARVFGASALTAAVVAFVTVVVYEGHVTGTSGGQTVNVAPGTTVELRADKPPSPPQVVGAAPSPAELQAKLHALDLEAKIRVLEADNQRLRDGVPAGAGEKVAPPTPSVPTHTTLTVTPTDPSRCDEVSCVLRNYDGACCTKFKSPPPPDGELPRELDRVIITDGMAPAKTKALECAQRSSAQGIVKVHVAVASDGSVTSVRVDQAPDPRLGTCVAHAIMSASFAKTQHGGSFSYPFVF